MNLSQRNHLWTELQTAIREQLARTPGEYDVITLIDRVSRSAGRMGLDYNKAATYLEQRYDQA